MKRCVPALCFVAALLGASAPAWADDPIFAPKVDPEEIPLDVHLKDKPIFRIIAEGLSGLVDGEDFFDTLAEDAVFEYVISVPGYPRRVVGREAVATALARATE